MFVTKCFYYFRRETILNGISGFRHEVAEKCALLGYYGAGSGNSLLTLAEGTDKLSRNVDKELPLLCVIIQKGAVLIGKFCG
jgi:hypothetical protein